MTTGKLSETLRESTKMLGERRWMTLPPPLWMRRKTLYFGTCSRAHSPWCLAQKDTHDDSSSNSTSNNDNNCNNNNKNNTSNVDNCNSIRRTIIDIIITMMMTRLLWATKIWSLAEMLVCVVAALIAAVKMTRICGIMPGAYTHQNQMKIDMIHIMIHKHYTICNYSIVLYSIDS